MRALRRVEWKVLYLNGLVNQKPIALISILDLHPFFLFQQGLTHQILIAAEVSLYVVWASDIHSGGTLGRWADHTKVWGIQGVWGYSQVCVHRWCDVRGLRSVEVSLA